MFKARVAPWQNAIIILSGTVVAFVVVTGLQWGRPVLIPIALAILLTLLLNPVVKKLQRIGCSRMPAVILGVSAAGLSILLIGGLVARQMAVLATELPQNTANIKARIMSLQQLAAEISSGVDVLTGQQPLQRTETTQTGLPEKTVAAEPAIEGPDSIPWLSLTGYLSSAFEVLATLAFTLILLVVFLIGRDDLRDRVVILAGKARIAVTSQALGDVTERISRYLIMVAVMNGSFGLMLALGLFALQIPYALLSGFVAGSLRFIPYLGTWIGAVCPIVIALATTEGWIRPLVVFGFVLTLELVSNNILEPLIFGHSTGVSPTVLIISAAFWFYLWGPIGLILSAPIAVCLMVLGRNIPSLSFLDLLLGSEPALRSDMGIYQRFLLDDELEATRLVLHRLKDARADAVFDEMLIPTLNYAKRDWLRGQLSVVNHKLILDGVQDTLNHTDRLLQTLAQPAADDPEISRQAMDRAPPIAGKRVKIIMCPAADESDCVAMDMLRQSLDRNQWDIRPTSVETLSSELVALIVVESPAILCIASLPPQGLRHARYLCKRLRKSFPRLPIIVGRWGQKRNGAFEREQLQPAGAGFVTTSLVETCQLLMSRLPLLNHEDSMVTHIRRHEPTDAVISAGN